MTAWLSISIAARALLAAVPATAGEAAGAAATSAGPLADLAPWLLPLLGGVAAGVAVSGWFAWRRARARGAPQQQLPPRGPEAPGLPEVREAPKVSLPPSEVETQAREVARLERERAEALRAERLRVAADVQAGQASEAEVRRLKDEEEEAKKAAYRAGKAAEVEERDRRRREREEAERRLAEDRERERAEVERRAREAEEERKRRIEAEAGQTLATGLAKTRSEGFMARLNGLFGAPKVIDEKVLAELEEVLFTADIGVRTASALVEVARSKTRAKELDSTEKIKSVIRAEVARMVDLKASHTLEGGGPPHVIMVIGVNGAGKTTTIGKLAAKATARGKRVLLAAGDTFRAAATEQLDVWAERAGAQLVKGRDEADPASVIFDAVKQARDTGVDLVIADTAGRLHTKANLMEELKKVKRVIEKALPGAPHEVLLVLDSTNGQNAIAQAKQFHEAVGVTAIALTKLDGTAKGGVVIGICDELRLPVAWVGVGEKIADLRPFEPREFVEALFE